MQAELTREYLEFYERTTFAFELARRLSPPLLLQVPDA
jgi:hypothetical protein